MAWSEQAVEPDGVRLVCRDWGGSGRPGVLHTVLLDFLESLE
ncbi:hypothetical protein [Streptomyces sp. NPDC056628]